METLTLVLAVVAIAGWMALGWIQYRHGYARWAQRFGERGLPGWFLGQWHRLIRLRPDWRMVTHKGVSWGPPACASAERRAEYEGLIDTASQEGAWRGVPDWQHLSDDELAERVKTAKLGEGLFAEAGYREWRKQAETKGGA